MIDQGILLLCMKRLSYPCPQLGLPTITIDFLILYIKDKWPVLPIYLWYACFDFSIVLRRPSHREKKQTGTISVFVLYIRVLEIQLVLEFPFLSPVQVASQFFHASWLINWPLFAGKPPPQCINHFALAWSSPFVLVVSRANPSSLFLVSCINGY